MQFRTAGFWVVEIAPGHDVDVLELGSLCDLGKGHPVESMRYGQYRAPDPREICSTQPARPRCSC